MNQQKIDPIVGKRFGKLVVKKLDEERTKNDEKYHRKFYICKCDCGNTKSINVNSLKRGATKSCGCITKELQKSKFIDITGQRFGKLVVTKKKENDPNDPIKSRKTGSWWYCDCDCGTKNFIAKGVFLRAGRVQSCGCYNKEASHEKNTVNLCGKKYGMLTVIEEIPKSDPIYEKRKNRSILWRCVCDCGNESIVSSNALRRGETVSCGCLSSRNEWLIKDHLKTLNIKFIPQYWFEDLVSPITGYKLKFDVAVLDSDDQISFIIEYDGEQHEYGSRFSPDPQVNEEKFKKLQLYDKIKNEYCKEHNIDLLRISFREKNKLLDIIDNKLKEKGIL